MFWRFTFLYPEHHIKGKFLLLPFQNPLQYGNGMGPTYGKGVPLAHWGVPDGEIPKSCNLRAGAGISSFRANPLLWQQSLRKLTFLHGTILAR